MNRIAMAAALGSDVIILHLPRGSDTGSRLDSVRRSLDAPAPYARDRGVRIALENMAYDDFAVIRGLPASYAPVFLTKAFETGSTFAEMVGR